MDEQKPLWKQLLEEAWRGIIGNTAYDTIKRILAFLWLVVGPLLASLGQRALGAAIPAVQDALSTEIAVLKLTVGTMATIAFLALGLVIIWLLFARKRRSEAGRQKQATEVKFEEQVQQITKLEGLLSDQDKLLEIERAQNEIMSLQLEATTGVEREEKAKVDKLTLALATLSQHVLNLFDRGEEKPDELEWSGALAASERAAKCARSALYHHVTKIVYYDPTYPASPWMDGENAEQTRKYFVDRWFVEKDAQQLQNWIYKVLENGEAYKSLIVFAQDIVPETVAEVPNETCLLRKYLNAGGRVVWRGDIPFWYQGKAGGAKEKWFKDGPRDVLGVLYHNYLLRGRGRVWDSDLPLKVTRMGKEISLAYSGKCTRPIECQDVDVTYVLIPQENFTRVDIPEYGRGGGDFALCWKKNFCERYPHSGFMQYVLGEFLWRDNTTASFFNFAVSGWPLFFD